MITIIDAVNDLRGDLANFESPNTRLHYGFKYTPFDELYWVIFDVSTPLPSACFTEGEFNQCVAEMSSGQFVPLADEEVSQVENKMKTIVDAVNDLRGDLDNLRSPNTRLLYRVRSTPFERTFWIMSKESVSSALCFTEGEFNQCVAEMSEGMFVPLANKSSEPEIQYDSDGNGYHVGAIYEFSDDGESWVVDRFDGLNEGHTYYKFGGDDCSWKYVRECASASIGKIHKKPVELIDGEVYSFTHEGGDVLGYYDKADSVFYWGAHNFSTEHCANITRLVPEKCQ